MCPLQKKDEAPSFPFCQTCLWRCTIAVRPLHPATLLTTSNSRYEDNEYQEYRSSEASEQSLAVCLFLASSGPLAPWSLECSNGGWTRCSYPKAGFSMSKIEILLCAIFSLSAPRNHPRLYPSILSTEYLDFSGDLHQGIANARMHNLNGWQHGVPSLCSNFCTSVLQQYPVVALAWAFVLMHKIRRNSNCQDMHAFAGRKGTAFDSIQFKNTICAATVQYSTRPAVPNILSLYFHPCRWLAFFGLFIASCLSLLLCVPEIYGYDNDFFFVLCSEYGLAGRKIKPEENRNIDGETCVM